MDDRRALLLELIEIARAVDTFGRIAGGQDLFHAAIGTLRKDTSIAYDVYRITDYESDGLGARGLTRIIADDLIHLLYLCNPPENFDSVRQFNDHVLLYHYLYILRAEKLGLEISVINSEDKERLKSNFDKVKQNFLRNTDESDPDSYSRSWTNAPLSKIITHLGQTAPEDYRQSIKFVMAGYDEDSAVIHHNAYLITALARGTISSRGDEDRRSSVGICILAFSAILEQVIDVIRKKLGDTKMYESELTLINDIVQRL